MQDIKYRQFYQEMGFRIKQMRHIRSLSSERLAEYVGVSRKTLQRYESGEARIPTFALKICARALNISVGYFYGEDEGAPIPANNNRIGLLIAGEIMKLPNKDIGQKTYHLVRAINNWWSEEAEAD